MAIEFSDPDEDYAYSAEDVESLFAPDQLMTLPNLCQALTRFSDRPDAFPYDCSPARAYTLVSEIAQQNEAGSVTDEMLARLPDDLHTTVTAIQSL